MCFEMMVMNGISVYLQRNSFLGSMGKNMDVAVGTDLEMEIP